MNNNELKESARAYMRESGLFTQVDDVRIEHFELYDRTLALAVIDGDVQHDCLMWCGTGWQRTVFTEGC